MKNSYKIVLAHLIYWFLDLIFDLLLHGIETRSFCYFQLTFVTFFYFIYFVLSPKLLKQPAIRNIGIWFVCCLIFYTLYMNIRSNLYVYLFFYDGSDEIDFIFDLELLLSFLYFASFSLGIRLYHNWLVNEEENKDLELRKSATQLQSYKNKIDLSSMNKALDIMQKMASEDASSVQNSIIELSNVLRYNIYESNKKKVTVGEELEIVKSQIFLNNELYNNELELSFSTEWNHVFIEPGVMIKAITKFLKINPKGECLKLIVTDNQLCLSIEDSKDRLILLKEELQKYMPKLISISKDQTNLQLQLATL